MSREDGEVICYCGAPIMEVGTDHPSWTHVPGEGDPEDRRYCYEEERGLDHDSRCTAMPEDE